MFSFSQPLPEFAGSKVMEHLDVDQDAGTSRIKPEEIGPVFVNDATEADVEFARAGAHIDFLGPSGTPITITDGNSLDTGDSPFISPKRSPTCSAP